MRYIIARILLPAVSIIYIAVFTILIAILAIHWFDFDIWLRPLPLMVTLLLAAATLAASPLLRSCRRWSRKHSEKSQHMTNY
ncbi:hypothetical protein PL75_07425 [Neisseria arctica]|uniref:Uncharacterized protein n=1 Tax=Neisseria arctica TaxID=1470200 RepID=A0A0J1C2P1_9NEIS|nr:hypothetical protein PL75_07425 [Neisseria arctica]